MTNYGDTAPDGTTRNTRTFNPNLTRMKVGAILVAISGLLGALGSLIAGVETAAATRRWLRDEHTAELARHHLRHAVAASQAARHAAVVAWRNGSEVELVR